MTTCSSVGICRRALPLLALCLCARVGGGNVFAGDGKGLSAQSLKAASAALTAAWQSMWTGGNVKAALKDALNGDFARFKMLFTGSSSGTRANAYGDPEVCCVWDNSSLTFTKVDVYGPFVTVCLNPDGTANALDFIGLCDRLGQNCQTSTAYYVAEIWRYEFSGSSFKYKDLRASIGGNNRHEFCADWGSVPEARGEPADTWLRPFGEGRSFFVWVEKPHVAVEGPSGATVTNFFSQQGAALLAQMVSNYSFTDQVGELVRDTLDVLTYTSGGNFAEQRQELGSYVLAASLAMGHKACADKA
mmetsp:Transcript_89359/g.208016  ORF Transcript_89359/g.208016 Transcript_89359/m.208016 type:complete len:303 (-) Transcript_89359:123-1031(-)